MTQPIQDSLQTMVRHSVSSVGPVAPDVVSPKQSDIEIEVSDVKVNGNHSPTTETTAEIDNKDSLVEHPVSSWC